MTKQNNMRINRRTFLAASVGAGVTIMNSKSVRGSAANSVISLGLLGCGGRGTVDARNLIDTGRARVVALADIFPDQLNNAAAQFDALQKTKGYPPIQKTQLFLGPDAYQGIAESKAIDAVVIATPPYFHPSHLEAVVAAGKHVYCEKPVGVDVAGALSVMDIGRRAAGRLSLEIGFQVRSAPPFVEWIAHLHRGALGNIACGEAHYFATFIDRPQWPNASPDERRLRNWIYDRTLSGDIIVEQDIHSVDVCNWALQAHPIRASAAGGRNDRTDSGDVYGHYNVVYSYPNEVNLSFSSTQFDKGWWDVNERFFGARGVAEAHYSGPVAIYGEAPWRWNPLRSQLKPEPKSFSPTGFFRDNLAEADAAKMNGFVESILGGKYHNQAEQGAIATLSCILARESAYNSRPMTWDELLRSRERWPLDINLNPFV